MKKPIEYLKELFEGEPFNIEDENSIEYDLLQVIKQAQLDIIEEVVKRCANNADADFTHLGDDLKKIGAEYIEVYVLKDSILNIAEQLRKEIE